jgi:hypothetical protein
MASELAKLGAGAGNGVARGGTGTAKILEEAGATFEASVLVAGADVLSAVAVDALPLLPASLDFS